MAKKKQPRSSKSWIEWRSGEPGKGGTARVWVFTDVCFPDGTVGKDYVKHSIGKVTLAEAEKMRDELDAGKTPTTPPVALISVEGFIDGYHYPNHVATLGVGGRKTAHEQLPHLISLL